MSVKLEDRPIEQVREETIDKLIVNYSHEVISKEAFERRLDEAMATTVHQELIDLVADLPMAADADYQQQKQASFGSDSAVSSQDEKLVSILSSNNRKGPWVVPARLKVIDVLGSITLDLSEAHFSQPNTEIEINSVLGSLSILVPENVAVISRASHILGSSDDYSPVREVATTNTITVTGWSVLGSVDVSVKRNMRERWLSFANSMREAFGLQRK
ncbi:LiaF domain-containing protein [Pseudidiomarina aquimaris]|uniref:LiaF domain-containing protein n=1 Tax=Pseudidiomarina aquimaris TaxID=641841 RepID=UPI003A984410|tara:strand:+ start:61 stop:708 length:648 start_codon:yes stop_codon:yes gene_type:complete